MHLVGLFFVFRLRWFGHVQKMEENRIPKWVLYMNLGTRLRGRPRNRWQDGVREDGRIVGGEGWQEKVRNREEWKTLLRTARMRRILHMPMEWMNEWTASATCSSGPVHKAGYPQHEKHLILLTAIRKRKFMKQAEARNRTLEWNPQCHPQCTVQNFNS